MPNKSAYFFCRFSLLPYLYIKCKELFKDTYIYNVEKEWTEYPVLFISRASGKHMEKEQLERYLGMRLAEYEERYGITQPAVDNVFYYR